MGVPTDEALSLLIAEKGKKSRIQDVIANIPPVVIPAPEFKPR